MGRKADINQGAGCAVLVLAAIVGVSTGSFWSFLGTCIVFRGLLAVLGVIR